MRPGYEDNAGRPQTKQRNPTGCDNTDQQIHGYWARRKMQ